MIRFEHLSKTFQTKDGAFEALKDVSFEIEKGDIYGVIGYSGAGKSTPDTNDKRPGKTDFRKDFR